MARASMSWFGEGRALPPALWESVCATAGCTEIAERPCPTAWAAQISRELDSLPIALLERAGIDHLFVASALQRNGDPHDGIAYETGRQRWAGLDSALFESEVTEKYFRVSQLCAVLVEEIVHVWDYALAARGSPYFSVNADGEVGPKWWKVECDQYGFPLPFAIPNRKVASTPEDQIAEDWASAVLWYLFRRDRLEAWSPKRHAFVASLFRDELQLA